jgi:hypothetical protein
MQQCTRSQTRYLRKRERKASPVAKGPECFLRLFLGLLLLLFLFLLLLLLLLLFLFDDRYIALGHGHRDVTIFGLGLLLLQGSEQAGLVVSDISG